MSDNKYSNRSAANLAEADIQLQRVFTRVLEFMDNSITCGYRNAATQNKKFAEGKSQLRYPFSKHNMLPAQAVDAQPYPRTEGHGQREQATFFAGIVMGVAAAMGIDLVWGGDWNGNMNLDDNNFDDLYHFELKKRST